MLLVGVGVGGGAGGGVGCWIAIFGGIRRCIEESRFVGGFVLGGLTVVAAVDVNHTHAASNVVQLQKLSLFLQALTFLLKALIVLCMRWMVT